MDAELLSEDELDERLRAGDPVDRVALDDDGVGTALLALSAAIETRAVHVDPRSSRPAARRMFRPRPRIVGAAAFAVAAASLIGVETLGGGAGSAGLPLAVAPAAAAVLSKAARVASAQAGPAASQWQYSETFVDQIQRATAAGATIEIGARQTVQTWVAADGANRVRVVAEGVAPVTNRGRAIYREHESAFWDLHLGLRDKVGDVQIDGLTTPAQARGFGREPAWDAQPPNEPHTLLVEIARSIRREYGTATVAGFTVRARAKFLQFQVLASILATSNSSRLRATAYRALSSLPDKRVLGTKTDALGRSGVAISFSAPNVGSTLLIDTRTGELIDEVQAYTRSTAGGPPDTVYRTVVGRRAIVASPTSLPGGGTLPVTRGR